MSKTGGTTTSRSISGPPPFQAPYINELLGESQRLYREHTPSFYPGSTVADFSPSEKRAFSMWGDYYFPQVSDLADSATRGFKFGTETAINPESNPYLMPAIEASTGNIFRELSERALPNIRAGYTQGGSFGGSRQALSEALATELATKAALESRNALLGGAYGQGLQTFGQTMAQAPMVAGLRMLPMEVFSAIGGQERAMEQANINESIARHEYGQNLPYNRLIEYGNVLRYPYGGYGESESIAPEFGRPEQLTAGILASLPALMQLFNVLGLGRPGGLGR